MQTNLRNIDKFALIVALINAIAFAIITMGATYVDSQIHHVIWGVRIYPWGYKVALLSFPLLICTYVLNSRKHTGFKKAIFTCISFISFIIITLILNFYKELPHMGVLNTSLSFLIILSAIVYMHNYQFNFDFLKDEQISDKVKLERVKIEHETWFRVLVYLIAAFAAIMAAGYAFIPNNARLLSENPKDIYLLNQALTISSVLEMMMCVWLFIEIFNKTILIKNQIITIKGVHRAICPIDMCPYREDLISKK